MTCDDAVGVQRATPSATYRSCMLAHGWKYSYVTRTKVQAAPAQADPYFSSNVKVKPGISSTMTTAWTARTSPAPRSNGTVHYFNPDQNLPCTRTGAMSVCANL